MLGNSMFWICISYKLGQEDWMVQDLQAEYWKSQCWTQGSRGQKGYPPHPHPFQVSLHLRNPIKRPPLVFWELSIQGGFIREIKPESI